LGATPEIRWKICPDTGHRTLEVLAKNIRSGLTGVMFRLLMASPAIAVAFKSAKL